MLAVTNCCQIVLIIIRCRYVARVEDEFVRMKECDESKAGRNKAVKRTVSREDELKLGVAVGIPTLQHVKSERTINF